MTLEGFVDVDGRLVRGDEIVAEPVVHHTRCMFTSSRGHFHVHTWVFRTNDGREYFGRNGGAEHTISVKATRVRRLAVLDDDGVVAVNGRVLVPGTEVSIKGERGRFRFQYATTTSRGRIVLTFVGGVGQTQAYRSFYPERVATVHRVAKMRPTTKGKNMEW